MPPTRRSSAARAAREVEKLLGSKECESIPQAVKMVCSSLRVNSESVRRTFYRRLARQRRGKLLHHRRALTDAEEEILSCWILGHALWSSPLTKLQILRSVNRVYRKKLSFQWLRRFLQRKRSLLRHCLARPIQTSRLRAWNPASVRSWINAIKTSWPPIPSPPTRGSTWTRPGWSPGPIGGGASLPPGARPNSGGPKGRGWRPP